MGIFSARGYFSDIAGDFGFIITKTWGTFTTYTITKYAITINADLLNQIFPQATLKIFCHIPILLATATSFNGADFNCLAMFTPALVNYPIFQVPYTGIFSLLSGYPKASPISLHFTVSALYSNLQECAGWLLVLYRVYFF